MVHPRTSQLTSQLTSLRLLCNYPLAAPLLLGDMLSSNIIVTCQDKDCMGTQMIHTMIQSCANGGHNVDYGKHFNRRS